MKKMKKNGFVFLSAGLLGLLMASAVHADNRPGATTLTLSDGIYRFAEKRHLDNVGVPNIQLAYNLNDHWAIEGGVGVINTNQKHYLGDNGVHGFLYTADGLYRFTPRCLFAPYVSAGVGVMGLKPNDNNNTTDQGNINAGVGTQLFIHKDIAFRCELKDIYTMSGGKNDVMLNLGISFLFGGEAESSGVYKGEEVSK